MGKGGYFQRQKKLIKPVPRRWRSANSSAGNAGLLAGCSAGSGAWALLMSPYARLITALDPSESMLECLREQVQKSDAKNIRVVPGLWPEMKVDQHDISFCSHAMYGAADFPGFISAMQAVTRKRCILLIRAPHPEGIMARAAQSVWGHRFDSPNFQIAYNILLDMGIYANVLMEDTGWWKPWCSSSLDAALDDLKSHLATLPR